MKIAKQDMEHLENVFETAQNALLKCASGGSTTGKAPEDDSDDDDVSTTAAGSTVGSTSVAGWGATTATVSPSPCR